MLVDTDATAWELCATFAMSVIATVFMSDAVFGAWDDLRVAALLAWLPVLFSLGLLGVVCFLLYCDMVTAIDHPNFGMPGALLKVHLNEAIKKIKFLFVFIFYLANSPIKAS